MSDDDKLYERAERRVNEKMGFYKHLCSYVIVNIFLVIINLISSPNNLWFYWATIGWGIGLIAHFFKVFIFHKFDETHRDDMIEKEMEKMKK